MAGINRMDTSKMLVASWRISSLLCHRYWENWGFQQPQFVTVAFSNLTSLYLILDSQPLSMSPKKLLPNDYPLALIILLVLFLLGPIPNALPPRAKTPLILKHRAGWLCTTPMSSHQSLINFLLFLHFQTSGNRVICPHNCLFFTSIHSIKTQNCIFPSALKLADCLDSLKQLNFTDPVLYTI